MYTLIATPRGGMWLTILFAIALIIAVPIITYNAGFRNGKRDGERVQLQKQVDGLNQKSH